VAKRDLAELKIPASAAFIPVAKRVASTLGGQLGLSLVDLDELSIALTQACDSAIEAARNLDGPADLKLNYFATNRALVVDVDLVSGQAHLKASAARPDTEVEAELHRLAYEMIRCFVDDFRPEVEPRTGHVRFRMVKYLAS
jgi:anti-sigma regulatory factor (Ser/Thr protein kinase)